MKTNITNAAFSDKLELEDVISSIEHIPLYLSSDVEYLHSIDKIRLYNNNIYILQEKDLGIFLYKFSYDGKLKSFLNGSVGKFKLYSVSDFIVNDSGLYLTDTYTSSVYLLDHSFNLLEKKLTPSSIGLKNIAFHHSKILARVDFSENNSNLPSLLYSYDTNEESLKPIEELNHLVNVPGMGTNIMYFENFHYTDKKNLTLYTDLINSDLYIIDNYKVLNKISIDFPEEIWIEKTELERIRSLTNEEISMMLLESKKSFVIEQAYMKGTIIVFTFTSIGKRYYAFVDTKNNSSIYFEYNLFNEKRNQIDRLVPLRNLSGIDANGKMIFSMDYELYKYYINLDENIDTEEFFSEREKGYICSHVISIATTTSMQEVFR
ncbi:hypothetical protein [Neolewinella agarilytica]|nr:hypothetical protein [Neolewinella agarilytica]